MPTVPFGCIVSELWSMTRYKDSVKYINDAILIVLFFILHRMLL